MTLSPQDLISNYPLCLPYNSFNFSSENLALDQLIISKQLFFNILIISLLDTILIWKEKFGRGHSWEWFMAHEKSFHLTAHFTLRV